MLSYLDTNVAILKALFNRNNHGYTRRKLHILNNIYK